MDGARSRTLRQVAAADGRPIGLRVLPVRDFPGFTPTDWSVNVSAAAPEGEPIEGGTDFMRTMLRRARRRPVGAATLAVAALAAGACTTEPQPPAACAPGAPPVALPAGSPWAGKLCVQADQKPPNGANGVIYRDGLLWIANLNGSQLVVADAATGQLVGRFGPDQGVKTGPDDLVMAADGTVYWTGMQTGEIGKLSPATGTSTPLANLGPWVNPIAQAPDGKLWVGHAFFASGISTVDPATGAVAGTNPNIAINGSAFGPDGALYAPRTDLLGGNLVRIDPLTHRVTTVASGIGLGSGGVEFPPAARHEPANTAYFLYGLPSAVRRLDVTNGRQVGPDIPIPTALFDNLTFAPDGTLFVTANTEPVVTAVGVDGGRRTIRLGRA
jgi:streptogramin lyase